MQQAKLFIDGRWTSGVQASTLLDKYTGAEIAKVHEASAEQASVALDTLAQAQRQGRTPHERYQILSASSELVARHRESFVHAVILDTGFTVSDAEREVERAIETLLVSAEEAKRLHGELVPLEGAPGVQGRYGFTVRAPLGVVCAITPFNSPLNTVAHKVAPALAAGNSVLIKPASQTPLSSGLLVRTLLDAGLPDDLIALVHGSGATVGECLLNSAVPAFYAFTGSTAVGEHIRRTVGLRKTQLELGSLSSTIVCSDANVQRAAALSVRAAFRKAGQVCTSVQRLYVEASILDEFLAAVTAELARCPSGDPWDQNTVVGPVISATEAERIESWIRSAVDAGATVVTGATRTNQVIAPTVLTDVTLDMDVMNKEVFGPVVCIRPFTDFDETTTEINSTPFGLAAGIFTSDIGRAISAAQELRMGSVHINETSSNRVDLMPYGGVKRSGLGSEGPRYAIEEMTEQRLITVGAP